MNPPKPQAAAPAYKFTDRRGTNSYTANNRLIGAARQQLDRKRLHPADKDFHRNISALGRRTLMTAGREAFWNIPAVQGMVLEQANLAVSTFIPQYYGANKAWGAQAEDWLYQWHKIGDVAGAPNDFESWVFGMIVAQIVDGDEGYLLTGNDPDQGYPMWQRIPAHRIYSYDYVVVGGEFDGARLIDGCIVNDYGRVIGYRVNDEEPLGAATINYRDISTRDMGLTFFPLFPGQLRGLSLLASSLFNFKDSIEFDRFEMLAQKVFASQTIIEQNETGDVDSAKALVTLQPTYDTSGNQTAPATQYLDGGEYRYFKANTGSKLEAFAWDRPAAAAQNFQERKIRDAFRGTEWDSFFSLDPQAVGGAPMRVIVAKINQVLKKRRKTVEKACNRVDGYGISKAIKLGDLPEDVDWWKWEYQGPGDVTADAKYDSDVGLQETAQGFSTRKIQAAKRGQYWEELDKQREAEARSDLQRAQRLATEFKITIQEALVILRPPTPSGQLPQPAPEPAPAAAKKGAP